MFTAESVWRQRSRAPPLARNSRSGRARAGWVGRPDFSSRRETSHANPILDHHDSVAMTPPPLHCIVQAGRKLHRSTLGIQLPLDHPAFRTLENDFRRRCVMQGALRATSTGRVKVRPKRTTLTKGVSHPFRRIKNLLLRTEYCTIGRVTFACYRIVGGRCLYKKWRYESRVPGSWLSVKVIREGFDPTAAL